MHKPNSAIERIKNHLAYKLGKVMIDFSHQRNNYKPKFLANGAKSLAPCPYALSLKTQINL